MHFARQRLGDVQPAAAAANTQSRSHDDKLSLFTKAQVIFLTYDCRKYGKKKKKSSHNENNRSNLGTDNFLHRGRTCRQVIEAHHQNVNFLELGVPGQNLGTLFRVYPLVLSCLKFAN